MPLKRRRERDETRKLGDMGKAMGWSRLNKNTAVNDDLEARSIRFENVGATMPGPGEYANVGKGHVKTKKAAVVKEANAGFNERENRRVQGLKDGSSARRKMAWEESQKDPNEPRKVIQVNSGNK